MIQHRFKAAEFDKLSIGDYLYSNPNALYPWASVEDIWPDDKVLLKAFSLTGKGETETAESREEFDYHDYWVFIPTTIEWEDLEVGYLLENIHISKTNVDGKQIITAIDSLGALTASGRRIPKSAINNYLLAAPFKHRINNKEAESQPTKEWTPAPELTQKEKADAYWQQFYGKK